MGANLIVDRIGAGRDGSLTECADAGVEPDTSLRAGYLEAGIANFLGRCISRVGRPWRGLPTFALRRRPDPRRRAVGAIPILDRRFAHRIVDTMRLIDGAKMGIEREPARRPNRGLLHLHDAVPEFLAARLIRACRAAPNDDG